VVIDVVQELPSEPLLQLVVAACGVSVNAELVPSEQT
jgi:hypothetical protein